MPGMQLVTIIVAIEFLILWVCTPFITLLIVVISERDLKTKKKNEQIPSEEDDD